METNDLKAFFLRYDDEARSFNKKEMLFSAYQVRFGEFLAC